MKQAGKNGFNVITNVSCLCQRCGINDRKWNFKQIGERLGQKSFSGTGWSNKKNIAFFNHNAIVIVITRPLL